MIAWSNEVLLCVSKSVLHITKNTLGVEQESVKHHKNHSEREDGTQSKEETRDVQVNEREESDLVEEYQRKCYQHESVSSTDGLNVEHGKSILIPAINLRCVVYSQICLQIVFVDNVLEQSQEILISSKFYQVDNVENEYHHGWPSGDLQIPFQLIMSQVNLSREQNELEYENCLVNAWLIYFVNYTIRALMLSFHVIARGVWAINESIIDDYVEHHEEYLENIDSQDAVILNIDVPPLIFQ